METMLLLSFAFVGFSMVLASFSAFYMYKFIRSYSGKFQKPMEYLFFAIALFALLIIESGFVIAVTPSLLLPASITLSLTAIGVSVLLLVISKAVYSAETEILIEGLKSKRDFLQRKSKLLREKFMKRKISEDMFKQLLLDLEKEIIDTDAKILTMRHGKSREAKNIASQA